ncbi:hypothetical protein, conserved [Plasmodium gonderi]|uniref:Uncharacterized protein n=1 Tax=Plasmodium gonderi TaxID=77519 RepID=A0A1Y1JH33_PLAGO|nr:hypothetical protein, conserved [Plasmodium gonderi]GAW81821.1 hypothetical protein, conserved [Plasmodium gonderi]
MKQEENNLLVNWGIFPTFSETSSSDSGSSCRSDSSECNHCTDYRSNNYDCQNICRRNSYTGSGREVWDQEYCDGVERIDNLMEKKNTQVSHDETSQSDGRREKNSNRVMKQTQTRKQCYENEQREFSYSDAEYTIVRKYLKGVLKNKERNKLYEFRKYLVEHNVFYMFVYLFVNLIRNKNNIRNPYNYVMNYFGRRDYNSDDNACMQDLIRENKMYRMKNQRLTNKINMLLVQIEDMQKRDSCDFIANFFFKNDKESDEPLKSLNPVKRRETYSSLESYSLCYIIKSVICGDPSVYTIQNYPKMSHDHCDNMEIPYFLFTRETFFLFLSSLSHSVRTEFRKVLEGKKIHLEKSELFNILLKELSLFLNNYLSFDQCREKKIH